MRKDLLKGSRTSVVFVLGAILLAGCGGKNACEAAGGSCVGLTPGGCLDGTVGDANRCACGGGVGVMCCLPADGES